jgi:type I restriction-modification system DNA methylase subunit
MSTALQLAMGIEAPHRNQSLFSDHYLNHLLPADPRWDAALPEAEAFLAWLQDLYRREQDHLADYNESQLEAHWFRPILSRLDHVFEPQAGVPGLDRQIKRPDYVFFLNEAARQAAVSAQKTDDYAAQALALGEVKAWDVPLGKRQKGGGASFDAQNPSFQIDYYLRATGLRWGMLSNGRLWRLVHADSSYRLSVYYEVDLLELLDRGDASAMRYFTLFFRQAAFRPDAQGRLFLADALAASKAYAVALEEDLKQNVYRALEKLMQGFLDLPGNGLGQADLRQIYENSLYLLYRLLFILYGESWGLLPIHNPAYRDHYSLDRLKREFSRLVTPPAPMTQKYWGYMQQLFQIINGDNAALNRHLGVPRYNGRLFAPEQHPFLAQKGVGDRALVEAVNLLSLRQGERGQLEFVDYRTLGVRQLGSIYEGLLEYQPRYASQPLVTIRDGKGERWVAEAESVRPLGSSKTPRVSPKVVERREAGQVYLETDRGERKATGSYYTPQYIVEYIVGNTLGPLVEEARERVKARAKGARGKAAQARAGQSFIDEILSLKALDPAMGSGHFLVEATEYLARALATDPYVETEAPTEEDLIHWKRRVVERCIYGVDRNPLAVELAKLSLWLATVAADKPLSFLDHHLQCGDSLVGARAADLGWAPPAILSKKAQKQLEAQKAGQVNMFEYLLSQGLPVMLGKVLEITGVESDSYETVQAKEAADQAVRELKAPFQAVADLWVSAYFVPEGGFGHQFSQGEYEEALGLIGKRDELLALPAVRRAREMGDERRFFHWELAFPEVFYDQNGQPLRDRAGFDAVVGNPPYDVLAEKEREENLKPLIAFFEDHPHVQAAFGRKIDLYRLFIAKVLNLLKKCARLSFIVPMSILADLQTLPLRRHILEQHGFTQIDAFPQKDDPKRRVFSEAKLPTSVIIIQREPDRVEPFHVFVHPGRLLEEISGSYTATAEQIAIFNKDSLLIPLLASEAAFKLAVRLASADEFKPMGKQLQTHQGEINETTMCDLLSRDPLTGPKVLRGGNVQRYEFLKDARQGTDKYVDVERYETTVGGKRVEHTKQYRIGYQRNSALDNWRRLIFAPLPVPSYCFDSISYYVVGEDKTWGHFLLALFNSELLNWRFSLTSTNNHVSTSEIAELPLRTIHFTTPADERARLAEEGCRLYQSCRLAPDFRGLRDLGSLKDFDVVLDFVEQQLSQEPERADAVHDLLAYLAGQMIEMNKHKQAAVEAFWLDLEGVTDAATFKRLRDKGKQEATLWKQATCRPFVSEESHATRSLDESLGWSEDAFKAFVKALAGDVEGLSKLVRVHQAHSPAYREIITRLEASDRLIDQVVYRLYRLTEEEVAVVEGRQALS